MESKFYSAPLAAWLATVALVLIVIGVALTLAAWREHKKKSEAIGAQINALRAGECAWNQIRCNRGADHATIAARPVLTHAYAERSRLSSLARVRTGFFSDSVGNSGAGKKSGR